MILKNVKVKKEMKKEEKSNVKQKEENQEIHREIMEIIIFLRLLKTMILLLKAMIRMHNPYYLQINFVIFFKFR